VPVLFPSDELTVLLRIDCCPGLLPNFTFISNGILAFARHSCGAFAAGAPGVIDEMHLLRGHWVGSVRTISDGLGKGRTVVIAGGAGMPCAACNVPEEDVAPRMPEALKLRSIGIRPQPAGGKSLAIEPVPEIWTGR
jgi:hypothetical protein